MSRSIVYSSRISKVRFEVSGTEDIVKESDVPIVTYDLFRNNEPYRGGVYDAHLGTTDHTYPCQTCFNGKKNCMGHDGHTVLNYPLLHPLFVQEIRKWLRLICFKCGNSIIDSSVWMKYPKAKRLDEASKIARTGEKSCPVCKTTHPTISKDKERPLLMLAKVGTEERKLYPHNIATILENISDETVTKLGKSIKSHPRKFVLSAIKIPPTTIRPDVKKTGSGRSSTGDLTTLLQNIIKKNSSIPAVLPDEIDASLESDIFALQEIYYAYVRGSPGKRVLTGGGNTPLNSLASRLRGKQGVHRKHQQGKRVRVVARTTITGDPTLKIDQLGIPLKFAKILQVEETVQEYNKARLMTNFLNGRNKYPGCSKIIRKSSGAEHNVEHPHSIPELSIGDIIYRDLQDGDFILFNRQPSLLPSSISGMEVVITMDPEILTFRMNVIACPWFNADFDGDQMNIYVGRSIASRNEIKRLSSVSNWFIKHADSSPMIGQADDSIIGSFILTRTKVRFDKYHAMVLFENCTFMPDFSDYDESVGYTGRDIISKILERTPINFKRKSAYYNKDLAGFIDYDSSETHVEIKRGKHIQGVLDKGSVGKGSIGGIYHLIANQYGENKVLEVIYNMQQVAIAFMYQHGYTIGIMDFLVTKDSLRKIHEIESTIIDKSNIITERLNNGEIIPPVGKTTEEFYEELQISTLRIMDDFAEPIFESIDPETNNLMRLILSKSKGSINHAYHIASSIGQIVISDNRPLQKFSFKRTLPQFSRFATDPEARGFIRNSYISGMNSTEFAFNAMNARFDFVTKALFTSVTGESERKSIKNLESLFINNLRMCVKHNNITQFLYGETGLDPRRVIKVKLHTVMISDAELAEGWKNSSDDKVFVDEFAAIQADRDKYRNDFLQLEQGNFNEPMSDERPVAVDIDKLISDEVYNHGEKKPKIDEIKKMVGMVKSLCDGIPYVLLNEIQERAKNRIPHHIKASVAILCMHIRISLNSKRSLYQINTEMLTNIIEKVRLRQSRALAAYGTAVGVIAAMSFSEPLTQYMLDAHHRTTTGGTSKSAMSEVKEVLGAKETSKLAEPSMILMPLPEYASESSLHAIANNIEVRKLGDFIALSQIFYEKLDNIIHPGYVHENEKVVGQFLKMNPLLTPPSDLIGWCIRLVFSRSKMIYKNMPLELVINKVRETYPDLYIVHTPENAKEIVMRVYVRNTYFKTHVEQKQLEELRDDLLQTNIRGISGIQSATVTKIIRHEVQPDGTLARSKEKFCIKTIGTNIEGVVAIKEIDPYGILTDAIDEIQRIFGIEAARQRLFTSVRNLGAGGLNEHHVSVYVDEMTYTGKVTSIEKQGLNVREANNVLLRMGFASPVQTLEEAAINAMEDPVQGITSPLLVGDIPTSIGTAYNNFHINENVVRQNTVRPDDWLDELGV